MSVQPAIAAHASATRTVAEAEAALKAAKEASYEAIIRFWSAQRSAAEVAALEAARIAEEAAYEVAHSARMAAHAVAKEVFQR